MKKNNSMRSKGGVVDIYAGETRGWWNSVNEDDIYASLKDPSFISYVSDVYQDAVYGYPIALVG